MAVFRREIAAAVITTGLIAGCAISRYESIDTCEFEVWKFIGTTWWSGTDCKGNKMDPTMLRGAAYDTKQMLDELDEAPEPPDNKQALDNDSDED